LNQPELQQIVLTGDLVDALSEDKSEAYSKVAEFARLLGKELLDSDKPDRILFVPGRTDWCKQTGFEHYNKFVKKWYDSSENIWEVAKTPEKATSPVSLLANSQDLGMLFVLVNSMWKSTEGKLEPGGIGLAQQKAIDSEIALRLKEAKPPRIVLMHDHVYPLVSNSTKQEHRLETQELAQDLKWLAQTGTHLVLQGQRHQDSMLLLRSSEWLSFSRRGELLFVGTGACLANDSMSRKDKNEKNQFQLLSVSVSPRPFLDSTVVNTPYLWNGKSWDPSEDSCSHVTHTSFQGSLVEAEQFTCDDISENTSHPLRSGTTDEWFWQHYVAAWADHSPLGDAHTSSSVQTKTAFLKSLIEKLREFNKSRSIFELLPFQLEAVYTFSAIFFTNDDIEKEAIREFNTDEWRSWLQFNSANNYLRWNHLDWANWIIGSEVNHWLMENKVSQAGIVDLGYGLLRTIDAIGHMIPPTVTERKYIGLDVSEELKIKVKQMVQEGSVSSNFFHDKKRIKPFQHINEYFLSVSGRKFWLDSSYPYRKEIEDDKFNIFVSAYAMHHCCNNFRVSKSLRDGSYFRFINCNDNQKLLRHLTCFKERLFLEATVTSRQDIIDDLVFLAKDRVPNGPEHYNPLIEQTPLSVPAHSYKSSDDIVRSYIDSILAKVYPNTQQQVYDSIYKTMGAKGLLCVADPNGMSRTFNRQEIFRNSAIAVAHFSDWPDTVKLLNKSGFKELKVFRQVRMNDLQVRRVQVSPSVIKIVIAEEKPNRELKRQIFGDLILAESFAGFPNPKLPEREVSALEVLDQHMGYIVVGAKSEG